MALFEAETRLDAAFPAQPTQIAAIRRAVTVAATGLGASDDDLLRLNLAVSEAATNAVVHAYRDGPEGHIRVILEHDDGCLAVRIRDDGIGMTPRTDSPGLGLGLGLIAHESDRCEIRSRPSGGTEVALRFVLSAGA